MIRILSLVSLLLCSGISFADEGCANGAQKPGDGKSCIDYVAETSPIHVESAYALPTSEAAKNGTVFMIIKNNGMKTDRLIDVRGTIAEKIEMHTMTMDDDVMKMREVGAYDLPIATATELTPGSNHIMLMNLTQPLKAGMTFPLTLDFDEAADLTIDVTVKAQDEEVHDHSHH